MKLSKQNIADITIVIFLFTIVILYLGDAYQASSKVSNLLLIVPVSIISGVFLVGILIQIGISVFANQKSLPVETEDKDEKQTSSEIKKIFSAMGLLAVFTLTINPLGFDVASFLFISLMLLLQGERRLSWLIGYPLVFSLLVSQFFSAMIPYPMPVLIQQEWIIGLF